MAAWAYSGLADFVVVFHAAFVCFVGIGGFAVLRWPRLARLHLPAALWGAAIELTDWPCPLTPLEKHLRQLAGEESYAGGFMAHYLLPLVYPPGLTRSGQLMIGALVIVANIVIYTLAWRRWRRPRRTTLPSG